MIYGYIRVSSDKQTVENQRFEINKFCENEKLKIDGWIEETISGTKSYDKRELGKLLKQVQKDDLIICAELSRLGRNLFMIMEILNICMTKECRVWTVNRYRVPTFHFLILLVSLIRCMPSNDIVYPLQSSISWQSEAHLFLLPFDFLCICVLLRI